MMDCIMVPVDGTVVCSYFDRLVGRFFKILPMFENEEESVCVYIRSLQMELSGVLNVLRLKNGDNVLTLISILDSICSDGVTRADVKREVFRAIKICNVIQDSYKGVDSL